MNKNIMLSNILRLSLCVAIAATPVMALAKKKKVEQTSVIVASAPASFSKLAKKALKATVNVSAVQAVSQKPPAIFGGIPGMGGGQGNPFEDMFKDFFEQFDKPRHVQAAGAGFIIEANDKKALIVTNYHVVKDSQSIKIGIGEDAEVNGILLSHDERNDIALVEINTTELPENLRKLPVLPFGESDKTEVGDWVMAIGNPFWLGNSVSVGIVSQKRMVPMQGQSDFEYIQHTAPINMGNSGGCLLNMAGEVIGVNRAIISNSGGNIGIGFAIPAKVVRFTIDQLKKHGRLRRSQLGVRVQSLTKDMISSLGLKGSGVIVGSVVKDGAADKILLPGDIIYKYDGKLISDKSALPKLVTETEIGKTVDIDVWRRAKSSQKFESKTLKVKLVELKPTEDKGKVSVGKLVKQREVVLNALDMQFVELTDSVKEHLSQNHGEVNGVMVKSIDSDLPAVDFPLRRGDVVAEANLQKINNLNDLKKIIDEAGKAGREHILALVYRGDAMLYIPIKLVTELSQRKTKKVVDKTEKKEEKKSTKIQAKKKK